MRRALITCAVAVVAARGSADTVPAEIKQSVAFVYSLMPDGKTSVPIGTGFFVVVADQVRLDRRSTYFVTAKHVLVNRTTGAVLTHASLRVNKKQGTSLTVPMPLVAEGPGRNVYFHEDRTVDLAVVPVQIRNPDVEYAVLASDMLTTREDFDRLHIAEGSEVFFVGLFVGYPGQERNYPIARFGRVALVTPEKIAWFGVPTELYLVESSAYGGNSGSPLFFSVGGYDRQTHSLVMGEPHITLAGVLIGHFKERLPLQAVETTTTLVSESNIGIAAVVPAYKLRELLFSDEVRRARGEALIPPLPRSLPRP
jgi:hypothetical protein